MSSKILLTGTSKQMHFVKITQKDGVLTTPKAVEGNRTIQLFLQCLYSVLSPFVAIEKVEKGQMGVLITSPVLRDCKGKP